MHPVPPSLPPTPTSNRGFVWDNVSGVSKIVCFLWLFFFFSSSSSFFLLLLLLLLLLLPLFLFLLLFLLLLLLLLVTCLSLRDKDQANRHTHTHTRWSGHRGVSCWVSTLCRFCCRLFLFSFTPFCDCASSVVILALFSHSRGSLLGDPFSGTSFGTQDSSEALSVSCPRNHFAEAFSCFLLLLRLPLVGACSFGGCTAHF